jgi:hypothetical protein
VHQRLQAQELYDRGLEFLEPGPLASGAGEAVPALGEHEPPDSPRHAIVDTLERPTTVSVRASEQRLQQLQRMGLLQAGIDAARSMKAQNSIEKMLCHHMTASHAAAMSLLGMLPGLGKPGDARPAVPLAEAARLANSAARLMDAFAAGTQALTRLKAGGTQRVVVQHQQLVVAQQGAGVLVSASAPKACRRRSREGRRRRK